MTIATGTEPKLVANGDVNSDGRKDILVSSFVSGNIAIVRSGVGNSFFNAALFPTFQRSGAVALGDFNSDGKPDVGVGNFDTNTVMALLNRNNCFTANKIVPTNAANFIGTKLTPEGIASSFGAGLATSTQVAAGIPLPTTLAGTTVKIKDSLGMEFLAPLFFVAAQQVNWQVPKGVAEGIASVTITSGAGSISTGTVEITKVAPGIFAASANGAGVLAASVLHIKPNGDRSFEQTALYLTVENKYVARELILEADDLFLEIYGTGIRNRSGLAQVTAKIGEVNAEVLYAGAHCCFVGVDQINVKISKTLAGRGEVDIVLTIDGKETNSLRLNVK